MVTRAAVMRDTSWKSRTARMDDRATNYHTAEPKVKSKTVNSLPDSVKLVNPLILVKHKEMFSNPLLARPDEDYNNGRQKPAPIPHLR